MPPRPDGTGEGLSSILYVCTSIYNIADVDVVYSYNTNTIHYTDTLYDKQD